MFVSVVLMLLFICCFCGIFLFWGLYTDTEELQIHVCNLTFFMESYLQIKNKNGEEKTPSAALFPSSAAGLCLTLSPVGRGHLSSPALAVHPAPVRGCHHPPLQRHSNSPRGNRGTNPHLRGNAYTPPVWHQGGRAWCPKSWELLPPPGASFPAPAGSSWG